MTPNDLPPFGFYAIAYTVAVLSAAGLDLLVRKNARARWAFAKFKRGLTALPNVTRQPRSRA